MAAPIRSTFKQMMNEVVAYGTAVKVSRANH